MATLVPPEKVYSEIEAGKGVLVDLRKDNDGIKIHARAVVFPYENVLGSDSGLTVVPGNWTREKCLEKITPDQLNVEWYHELGSLYLEDIRKETRNKNLDHAGAQKYVRERLAMMENNFGQFVKDTVKNELARAHEALASLRAEYASGNVSEYTAKQVKAAREAFDRYLKLPPHTPSRFAPLDPDPAVNDNHDFQDGILSQVRQVGGNQLDHESAHAYLKKRGLTPEALKNDKVFVENFFAQICADRAEIRAKKVIETEGSRTTLNAEDKENLATEKTRFAKYLKYKTEPSMADLAEGYSDETLKRMAGVYYANLGDHWKDAVKANAQAAIKLLPSARPLYLIDFAGVKSMKVADALTAAGAGDIYVVAGGTDRWVSRGLPCEPTAATEAALEAHLAAGRRGMPNIQEIND